MRRSAAIRTVFKTNDILFHVCHTGGWEVVAVLRGVNVASAKATEHFKRPTLEQLAIPGYEFGHLCFKGAENTRRQYIDVSEHGSTRQLVYMPLPHCKIEYERLAHRFFTAEQPDSVTKKVLVLTQRQLSSIRVPYEVRYGLKFRRPTDAVRKTLAHAGGVWSLLARRERVLKRKRVRTKITFGNTHDKAIARLLELFGTDPVLGQMPTCVQQKVMSAAATAP